MELEFHGILNGIICGLIVTLLGYFCREQVYPYVHRWFFGEIKIDSIGYRFPGGTNGGSFDVAITNVGLRTIAIKEVVFVLMLENGNFRIPIVKYKEKYLEIEPGHSAVVRGNEFTEFRPHIDVDKHIKSINVGFEEPTGTVVWVKKYGKSNGKLLDKICCENDFVPSVIIRRKYGDKVLAPNVKRVVKLRYLNHFDEVKTATFFVYENGTVFDDTGDARHMTQEEYNDDDKFLNWFRNHFKLYKDDIHIFLYD